MKIESITFAPTEWEELDDAELRSGVTMRWRNLRRRTVRESWDIGRGLLLIKKSYPHGGFLSWLQGADISHDTAKRLMKLADELEMVQIAPFDSVTDALKYIKSRERARTPKADQPAPDPQLQKREADERAMQAEIAHEMEIIDAEITEDRAMQAEIRGIEADKADTDDELARLKFALERTEDMRRKAVQRAETAERKLKRICDDLCRVRGIDDAVGKVDDILANHFRTGRKAQ